VPAVRQKLHLSPCPNFRSRLSEGLCLAVLVIFVCAFIYDAPKQLNTADSTITGWRTAWEKQAIDDGKRIDRLEAKVADIEASVKFKYQTDPDYIIPPQERKGYGNDAKWAVRLGISSNRTIESSVVYVGTICQWRNEQWSRPINERVPAELAWFSWTPPGAFGAKDLAGNDFVALFKANQEGRKLRLVTRNNEPELDVVVKEGMPPGRYLLEVLLRSRSLRSGEAKTLLLLNWDGKMPNISIALYPRQSENYPTELRGVFELCLR